MIEMTEVAVRACTNALRVVKALDGHTRGIAPMVATALLWPGVFPLLQARLARPQLAGAWLAIARELPEPARGEGGSAGRAQRASPRRIRAKWTLCTWMYNFGMRITSARRAPSCPSFLTGWVTARRSP